MYKKCLSLNHSDLEQAKESVPGLIGVDGTVQQKDRPGIVNTCTYCTESDHEF